MDDSTDKSKPKSIHTFMWPFRWSAEANNSKDILASFSDCLLKDVKWKEEGFKLSNPQHYNEYVYYHSHVRDTLYANADNKETIRYFNYQINKKETFEFEVIDENEENGLKHFNLEIKNISLHIFFTGVGILTFQLENNNYTTIGEIQLINDFGRRTYPQYLGNGSQENQKGVNATKRSFLPKNIKVSYCEEKETFESFNKYENINLHQIIQPPAYIKSLFCNDFVFSEKTCWDETKITITHLTDDRMYTLCWYPNELLSRKLKAKSKASNYKEYMFLGNPDWYKLIFCDSKNGLTCQSDIMLRQHTLDYTYDRWVNYGTLYGITRDCLFCLTDEGDFARDAILLHMRSVYYQMAILCLAQRASVQKISYDLTQTLKELDGNKLNSTQTKQAVSIQTMYLKFNNLLSFKEVTDQIQGIEMYQKMQVAMGIQGITDQLDREIEELHSLLNMDESIKLSEEANLISRIAMYTVPASLVMALFALFSGDLVFSSSYDISPGRSYAIVLLVAVSVITLLSGKWIISKTINKTIRKNE
ncbi:hypothetical protein [Anditalea andensis]|uniref:CorA-like Mg2+ transporter protein n=1 Tax=Anditalea andensis TaxID=1048983 RepID=A0A074LPQ0_9BACT|nr:hypothetical protein [Anditalea andensis]KEO75917.1 hypothetical protein EL17_20175 [Anditalea andensis]